MTLQSAMPAAVNGGGPALPGTISRGRGKSALTDFTSLLGSQSAAMMQSTLPAAPNITGIVDALTNALLRAAGKTNDATARSTLQRALTAALAPPGDPSPPQAATLERRLRDLLKSLTGETATTNAGQQNEIPGQLLDASPAKESPAPQKKTTQSGPFADDIAAFARALLTQSQSHSEPQLQQASAPAQTASAAVQPHVAKAANDVLARIIARAVNADAQRSGSAPAAGSSAAFKPLNSSIAFQNLVASIAEYNAAGGNGAGGHANRDGGETPAQPQPETLAPGASISALPIAHETTPIAAAPAQRELLPYATVDPNAVIEQVVKGIVVQSSSGSSQIRLRLQPEHLGEVALQLTVTGNSISANVVAQSASVRDALLSNQSQLMRSLAESGLSLGSFSVNVSGGNAGQGGDEQTQHRSAGFKLGGWQAAFGNDDATAPEMRFGPALMTGTQSLVLNSLV